MGRQLGTDMVELIRLARAIPLHKKTAFDGIMYIKGRRHYPTTFKKAVDIAKMAIWKR